MVLRPALYYARGMKDEVVVEQRNERRTYGRVRTTTSSLLARFRRSYSSRLFIIANERGGRNIII